jgi:uncharacterized membrane protein (UPF0182 family)
MIRLAAFAKNSPTGPGFSSARVRPSLPSGKGHAVFFNNQLGYTADLADSIDQVLGRTIRAPPTPGPQPPGPSRATPTALARIIQQQAEEYTRAQQALDRHDLGAYQQAIDRLGQLIGQARRLTGTPPPTTQAASPP